MPSIARARRAFWDAQYHELLARYPDQFVAVRDDEVVAHRCCLRDLALELNERGLDPRETWIEFMRATDRSVML